MPLVKSSQNKIYGIPFPTTNNPNNYHTRPSALNNSVCSNTSDVTIYGTPNASVQSEDLDTSSNDEVFATPEIRDPGDQDSKIDSYGFDSYRPIGPRQSSMSSIPDRVYKLNGHPFLTPLASRKTVSVKLGENRSTAFSRDILDGEEIFKAPEVPPPQRSSKVRRSVRHEPLMPRPVDQQRANSMVSLQPGHVHRYINDKNGLRIRNISTEKNVCASYKKRWIFCLDCVFGG